jgi:hypothetical protein
VLRVGVFELTKMDTPSHAAINEAVELAKHAVRPQVRGTLHLNKIGCLASGELSS